MITSIGVFLRKLRMENGEILKVMAEKLGVSSAFLSAVENGKKKMPEAWYEKLTKLYRLSPAQLVKLKEAVLESSDIVELNIKNVSSTNRALAISFARKFESLDEETAEMIFSVLKSNKMED